MHSMTGATYYYCMHVYARWYVGCNCIRAFNLHACTVAIMPNEQDKRDNNDNKTTDSM